MFGNVWSGLIWTGPGIVQERDAGGCQLASSSQPRASKKFSVGCVTVPNIQISETCLSFCHVLISVISDVNSILDS